ncbi:EscF/YscF/HrpA family type III secretion system needle major subunit [Noviherbaspirillum sp.]|uniref:EscF/YscF/HrpA family type III secretion system needle major subunit n=1 Tax=Noviherbaspirillum sp. TaxID=1926288 RepID=UPI002B4833BF|nr:EscF/YscF/HrpA family type III secretion system needle major subunit [Noviherbaspirillum sp.]HJV80589.1 EscF/YscF/HrpA family type III secretion system needle major subunit [Noviherbaspirillum sp.]
MPSTHFSGTGVYTQMSGTLDAANTRMQDIMNSLAGTTELSPQELLRMQTELATLQNVTSLVATLIKDANDMIKDVLQKM